MSQKPMAALPPSPQTALVDIANLNTAFNNVLVSMGFVMNALSLQLKVDRFQSLNVIHANNHYLLSATGFVPGATANVHELLSLDLKQFDKLLLGQWQRLDELEMVAAYASKEQGPLQLRRAALEQEHALEAQRVREEQERQREAQEKQRVAEALEVEKRAQEQRAQEKRAQEQRAQEQRAQEQRAQEQRAQEQRAQEQRVREQRAQEQRIQEQRAFAMQSSPMNITSPVNGDVSKFTNPTDILKNLYTQAPATNALPPPPPPPPQAQPVTTDPTSATGEGGMIGDEYFQYGNEMSQFDDFVSVGFGEDEQGSGIEMRDYSASGPMNGATGDTSLVLVNASVSLPALVLAPTVSLAPVLALAPVVPLITPPMLAPAPAPASVPDRAPAPAPPAPLDDANYGMLMLGTGEGNDFDMGDMLVDDVNSNMNDIFDELGLNL